MYKLRTTNTLVNARGGPLWLLTFWGFLYFPSLVSIKSPEAITNDVCTSPSSACCYGEVATLLLSVPSGKLAAEILSALLEPSPLSGPNKVNWHPCSAKDEMNGPLDSFSSWAKFAVPQWLRETNPVMYKSEDSAHWQSILAQRDLLYVGPNAIGVEVYNPNLAARQFGLIQACAVPLYQTQNRPWGSRLDFIVRYKKDKKLEWKYKIEKSLTSSHTCKITDFNVQPWVRCADVDDGFSIWWNDFWSRHQKAKTLITSQQILIKALDKNRFKSNTLDTTPSSIGNRKETEAAKGPSPEMATRTSIPDNRISPSASYIPQLNVDPNMETLNKKVAEEEEDDIMPLRRLKRRKKKGVNDLTPVSLDNPGKQGRIAESRENIEANEDPSMLSMIVLSYVETPIQSVFPISSSSMLPETTTKPLMTENIDNTPLNGPSNISLNVTEKFTSEPRNQHEVAKACDSVESFGNISARIEHVLKALSHDPSHNISRLESKKASLLDTLEELVNNPKSFDSFDALMGLAQEFTGLAPSSYQSTMDHLKKSITSIQDVSYKLKTQGPQILSSLEKKHSMEQQRLEVEKKFDEVHTLQKTHVYICTEIAFLEAELMKLEQERDAVEEQLADVDNELASLSHQLEHSVAALENEADWLAKAESIRKSWDLDMKVFKSAIVGIIKQLQSF